MKEKIFKISWKEDLGEGWMNIFNLEQCLYSSTHTNKDLVKVEELPKDEEKPKFCYAPMRSMKEPQEKLYANSKPLLKKEFPKLYESQEKVKLPKNLHSIISELEGIKKDLIRYLKERE